MTDALDSARVEEAAAPRTQPWGAPGLLRSVSSSYSPPVGKLSPETFDLPFQYATEHLWIVAVDGSQLGMRALRLAAWLMNPKISLHSAGGQDNILVVHCIPAGAPMTPRTQNEPTALFANAKAELMKCGVWEKRISCKAIELPDGWSPADGIIYFANHVGLNHDTHAVHARLVLGCAGEQKSTGQYARLGSIAKQCLATVKVPVTVVKEGRWVVQECGAGRLQRLGRNGQPGCTMFCCVDGSSTSDMALDVAVSTCREGDTLHVLYVSSTDRPGQAEELRNKYETECGKLVASKGLAACTYIECPEKGASVAETIIEATGDADLVVMGSVELADVKKRHVLGSVCMAIARHPTAHLTIVKNYPQ